jgi:hypothetical protein
MGRIRTWWFGSAALVAVLALVFAGAPRALAQDPTPTAAVAGVTTPPVDLHNGTCANPQLEPDYELGDLRGVPFVVDVDYGILDEDYDDDGILDTDEDGYLSEDLDGDGVLDAGEDLDGDGVLGIGFDLNGDGILDANEVFVGVEAPNAAVTVYKAEAEIDATFEDLFASPEVIAVHKNANEYDTIIACGDLGSVPGEPEGEVVVPIQPVNGSGYYGYAVFQEDTGDAPAIPIFGDDTTGVTVYLFQGLTTQRDERAFGMGTPVPAPPTPAP